MNTTFIDTKFNIKIYSRLYKSESRKKVNKAIINLFPDLNLILENDIIYGISDNSNTLNSFCNKIKKQQILDAARKYVNQNVIIKTEDYSNKISTIKLSINKQIAYNNKINFCSFPNESPLGPINIEISLSKVDEFIDAFFPKFESINENKIDH